MYAVLIIYVAALVVGAVPADTASTVAGEVTGFESGQFVAATEERTDDHVRSSDNGYRFLRRILSHDPVGSEGSPWMWIAEDEEVDAETYAIDEIEHIFEQISRFHTEDLLIHINLTRPAWRIIIHLE